MLARIKAWIKSPCSQWAHNLEQLSLPYKIIALKLSFLQLGYDRVGNQDNVWFLLIQ